MIFIKPQKNFWKHLWEKWQQLVFLYQPRTYWVHTAIVFKAIFFYTMTYPEESLEFVVNFSNIVAQKIKGNKGGKNAEVLQVYYMLFNAIKIWYGLPPIFCLFTSSLRQQHHGLRDITCGFSYIPQSDG